MGWNENRTIAVRPYQRDIVIELAKREDRTIVDVMDDILWYGWKNLGYDVEEIEREA